MTWRGAAELARHEATLARRQADELRADDAQVAEFDRGERPALVRWLKRRIAQEFDRFANVCKRRADEEDTTVIERGPKATR